MFRPCSNSHTLLARILQKLNSLDIICKNLKIILHFIQNLSGSCRSYISCIFNRSLHSFFSRVIPRFRHFPPICFQDSDILARFCKIGHFLPRSSKIPARILLCLSRSLKWNLTYSCRKSSTRGFLGRFKT